MRSYSHRRGTADRQAERDESGRGKRSHVGKGLVGEEVWTSS